MPESILAVVLAVILLFGIAIGTLGLIGLGRTDAEAGPAFIDEDPSPETEQCIFKQSGEVIVTAPRAALSVGSIRFVSSTNATQSTALLTITPVGLSPTEHASFSLDALVRQ